MFGKELGEMMDEKERATTEEFIDCDCLCELIRLEYDEEDNIVYVSMYERGTKNIGLLDDFKYRIRHCWRILKHGSPWEDEIIIGYEQIQKLHDYTERTMFLMEKRAR